jgi:hypothetical protein
MNPPFAGRTLNPIGAMLLCVIAGLIIGVPGELVTVATGLICCIPLFRK